MKGKFLVGLFISVLIFSGCSNENISGQVSNNEGNNFNIGESEKENKGEIEESPIEDSEEATEVKEEAKEDDGVEIIHGIKCIKNGETKKTIDLNIEKNPLLQRVLECEWEYGCARDVVGEKDSYFDRYYVYFDQGIKIEHNENSGDEGYSITGRISNIVYNDKFKGEVLEGISVQTPWDEIKNILGEPAFVDEEKHLIGYKGEEMHVFFREGEKREISIYRTDKLEDEKILVEFIKKFGNQREEMYETYESAKEIHNFFIEKFKDYDYEYLAGYKYSNRVSQSGVGLECQGLYMHIGFYEHYYSGIYIGNNFEGYIPMSLLENENTEAVKPFIKMELDSDYVFNKEITRINVDNGISEKINESNVGVSPNGEMQILFNNDGSISPALSGAFIIYLNKDKPNREIRSVNFFSGYEWINNRYIAYDCWKNGIWIYDIEKDEHMKLPAETEVDEVLHAEGGKLECMHQCGDGENYYIYYAFDENGEIIIGEQNTEKESGNLDDIDEIKCVKNEMTKDTIALNVEENPLLQRVLECEWEYGCARDVMGEKDSYFDRYDIYFDQGIKIEHNENLGDEGYSITGRISNIVYNDKFKGKVLEGISVETPWDEIKNILGEPAFVDEEKHLIGYKGKKMYVFFREGEKREISIHRRDQLEDENILVDFIKKFGDKGESEYETYQIGNEIYDFFMERFENYSYQYNGGYKYSNRVCKTGVGIETQGLHMRVGASEWEVSGIWVGNNFEGYIPESLLVDKSESDEDGEEIQPFIKLELDEDYIFSNEKNRINIESRIQEDTEECENISPNGEMKIFHNYDGSISPGLGGAFIVNIKGDKPNIELRSIHSFGGAEWINDRYIAYDCWKSGVWVYDIKKDQSIKVPTESDLDELGIVEDGKISCYPQSFEKGGYSVSYTFDENGEIIIEENKELQQN